MKIEAGNGCWLTESCEVPNIKDRSFVKSVTVTSAEELAQWTEVTDTEKERMTAQAGMFEVEKVDTGYLGKVDTMLGSIASKINEAGLSVEDALAYARYYPRWEDLVGELEFAGYRFRYGDVLYEVVQPHTFAGEWVPGQGTDALYKVVQEEHEGTGGDPIPWQHGMELEEGKYYTDNGVLYLCVRDSGMGLSYDLADLVSGGYVEPVEEPEQPGGGSGEGTGDGGEATPVQPAEPDGTKDNPISYTAGQTPLEQGKYYTEDGLLYLCIQQGGVVIYDLSQIPAIAQPVTE